ncbi:MAG TPA: hypothetical protein VFF48_02510, partial [Brevundimonas sp.]|nr:hypothetical protein [Brevundimonas sp.]
MFTHLESAVLDALAWDLSEIAPDLAGQFAESLPGRRVNTGSGLFTEVIVAHSRPAPLTDPTGRFGTVHAMVADLPDSIAFRAELRHGRLLGLHGDAYGQDTRHIDFQTAPFEQVFTVDAQGVSVPYDPGAGVPRDPPPIIDEPGPPRSVPAADTLARLDRKPDPDPFAMHADNAPPADATNEDDLSLLIGVWVAIAALTAILFIVTDLGFAVLIPAGWAAVIVRRPKVLAA